MCWLPFLVGRVAGVDAPTEALRHVDEPDAEAHTIQSSAEGLFRMRKHWLATQLFSSNAFQAVLSNSTDDRERLIIQSKFVYVTL